LEELFADRFVNVEEVRIRLKREAQKLGLPFGDRTRTYNSRLAQELGKWAESQGKGDEYHLALFMAYFVDGRNIGKHGVLIEIAESLDLPAEKAREVLERRAYREAVDSDWILSRERGILAAPTFLIGKALLVGAQPYEKLERLLESEQVPRRI
jgi:predicted DsbA family dithiol-disulfide isomerase